MKTTNGRGRQRQLTVHFTTYTDTLKVRRIDEGLDTFRANFYMRANVLWQIALTIDLEIVCPAELPTQTTEVMPVKNDSPPSKGPSPSHKNARPQENAVRNPASTLTRKSLGGQYAGVFCDTRRRSKAYIPITSQPNKSREDALE